MTISEVSSFEHRPLQRTIEEIASFEGSPRGVYPERNRRTWRPIRIGFSGQTESPERSRGKRIGDFERRKENFLI